MSDLGLFDRVQRRVLRATLRLPRRVRARIAGAPPVNDRGTVLDPETHWVAWLDARLGMAMVHSSVRSAREGMVRAVQVVESAPAEVRSCDDPSVGGVPARRYVPFVQHPPVLVYLHGGGWACGDLRTHDRLCRRLCAEAGYLVISVDYRLAPEHPYPAGRDGCVAALRDVLGRAEELGGDPDRVVVGGDSAGGNIAALACLALRNAGGPLPAHQLLIYPATDLRRLTESYRLFAEGFLLTGAQIDWYLAQYRAEPEDPGASPLLATSHAGLPPATVVTAGFDPLRDEGEAYVATLEEAGVPVTHLHAADLVHGFANMDGAVPAADRMVGRIVHALRDAALQPPRTASSSTSNTSSDPGGITSGTPRLP